MSADTVSRHEAYIGLGTNIGDREENLRRALEMLDEAEGVSVVRRSAVYETEPVGYVDQPSFLNMVAVVDTSLPPEQLLDVMLCVERTLGRIRDIRWGPRTIDLDLLLYGHLTIHTERLDVPHPRMTERAFVWIPLLDVIDYEPFPDIGTLQDIRMKLDGKEGVTRWNRTMR